jgi:peptidoglycan/xylan/chitin deacetylase (PgdA/CDA1 family)
MKHLLLFFLLVAQLRAQPQIQFGGISRGDVSRKQLTLVFTGHEFADGAPVIIRTLARQHVKGAFFFTGEFYRNPQFASIIYQLKRNGHFLGAHSDKHLLYCDWTKRDSLLVTEDEFRTDLEANYRSMARFGIRKRDAPYFLPPYEWYNAAIANWAQKMNLTLVNFTGGTSSNADYTTPDMPNYRSSEAIMQRIKSYEQSDPNGLNGFMLLIHFGTDPKRTDKLYNRLEELILYLKAKGYTFVSLPQLLKP